MSNKLNFKKCEFAIFGQSKMKFSIFIAALDGLLCRRDKAIGSAATREINPRMVASIIESCRCGQE